MLVTIDFKHNLRVFQFRNHSDIFPLGDSYRLKPDSQQYQCVKIQSFVQDRPSESKEHKVSAAAFRLFVVAMFKAKDVNEKKYVVLGRGVF